MYAAAAFAFEGEDGGKPGLMWDLQADNAQSYVHFQPQLDPSNLYLRQNTGELRPQYAWAMDCHNLNLYCKQWRLE